VKKTKGLSESVNSFIEEMVVRRELSDNFCFYNPSYDSLECAADWAKQTLEVVRHFVPLLFSSLS
jgi:deoxyribodipyrimidine photo-lyase